MEFFAYGIAFFFVLAVFGVLANSEKFKHPGLTMAGMGFLAIASSMSPRLSEVAVTFSNFTARLSAVETNLQTVAQVLDTVLRVETFTTLAPDNSLTLAYEPVPRSVKIFHGTLVYRPGLGNDYSLDGRRVLPDARWAATLRKLLADNVPITVEYVRLLPSDLLATPN